MGVPGTQRYEQTAIIPCQNNNYIYEDLKASWSEMSQQQRFLLFFKIWIKCFLAFVTERGKMSGHKFKKLYAILVTEKLVDSVVVSQ